MPTALRDLVERTIRDSMPDLTDADLLMMGGSNDGDGNNTTLDDHADAVENSPAGTATPVSGAGWTADARTVEHEFLAQGFRKGHVSRAIAYARSSAATTTTTAGAALPLSTLRHEVLSHLHLLVPESDLPAAFQSSKPSDTTIRNATAKNRDELGRMWKAEKVAREVGTPVEWVVAELDKIRPLLPEGDVERKEEEASSSSFSESEIEGRLLEVLARRMMDVEATTDDADVRRKLGEDELRAAWASSTLESPAAAPELRQRREDELVGLEGVFGARYSRRKDGFEIAIPSSGKSDAIALRILFHPSSRYPSPQQDEETDLPAALPAFYITSPTLPPYIRLHLVYLLSSSFVPSSPVSTNGGAWLELVDAGYGGVVGEMVAFLEEHARSVIDNPPDARTVMDRLLPASQRTGALLAANVAQKVTKAANGGNLRNGRRSRKLRVTPEEQAALKRSYEALQQTPEYGKMLQQRQRLPAWGMRDQIVDLIRKSRVTIVCGETGSGKTTQGALVRLLTSSWRTRECSLCFRTSPGFRPRRCHPARRGRHDFDRCHSAPSSLGHRSRVPSCPRTLRRFVPFATSARGQPRWLCDPRRASRRTGVPRPVLYDRSRARSPRSWGRSRPRRRLAHFHRRSARTIRRFGFPLARVAGHPQTQPEHQGHLGARFSTRSFCLDGDLR